ncbi:MAG: NAD(P)H-hydrate epimerase [Anaerovoracaceae bacterium]
MRDNLQLQKDLQVVTCAQMKEIERMAAEGGLSYYQMMENAGTGAAKFIMDKFPVKDRRVYVFCGKGNNGGDGFVAARILHQNGANVVLVLVEGEPKTEDAITNSRLCRELRIPCIVPEELPDPKELSADAVIVDAIYGTGFHGELRDNVRKATVWINNAGNTCGSVNHARDRATVFSLDIPSGLNGDTGQCDPDAVRADYTLAFHRFKPVHIMEEAQSMLGEVVCIDIGIPDGDGH